MTEILQLTPAQERAYSELLVGVDNADVVVLRGRTGAGKTSILRKAHDACGGAWLGMREFMRVLDGRLPEAMEESFLQILDQAMAAHDIVFFDDLHLIGDMLQRYGYARHGLIDAAATAALDCARMQGKKLVFAASGRPPEPVARRAWACRIDEFTPEDYQCLCRTFLREQAACLDYARIHRFVPSLNAHQLRNACRWHGLGAALETEAFVAYLRARYLKSNVELEEVECVDWTTLKGVDNVLRELEAKIALPFENDELSAELHLKPKRGVLLSGPPGTGKTTIGRALAHRLKGKFFLVDGTVVAGTGDFYCKLESIFDAARKNAPSVVFIDDADVIFEDEDHGFYRYLLTILDGLESASSGRVCVMMTAMHPGSLPQAMVRSGRIELWLETKLPDLDARTLILRERLEGLPEPLASVDARQLAAAGRNLTGADLKNVVEDAKLLFAHDRVRGRRIRPPAEYFLEAIETVRKHRRDYARSKPPKLAENIKVGFGAA